MSVTIDTVTIGSIEDRRLVLGNSQIAAPILIGGVQSNAWVRIRLALRLSFDDLGSTPIGLPQLWLGVMGNPTADGLGNLNNGPLNDNTSHFVGWATNGTMTRSAGPPVIYSHATNAYRTKIGSTVVAQAQTGSNFAYSADPTANRYSVMFELTKGAGTTDWVGRSLRTSSGSAGDLTLSLWNTALELSDLTSTATALSANVPSAAVLAATLSSLTIDEAANGDLNAIVVAWDRGGGATNHKVHISDFNYVLFPS